MATATTTTFSIVISDHQRMQPLRIDGTMRKWRPCHERKPSFCRRRETFWYVAVDIPLRIRRHTVSRATFTTTREELLAVLVPEGAAKEETLRCIQRTVVVTKTMWPLCVATWDATI